jgi:hypothetical protein
MDVVQNPDEEGLKTFLVDRLGFNVERVTKGIAKLKDARGKTNQARTPDPHSCILCLIATYRFLVKHLLPSAGPCLFPSLAWVCTAVSLLFSLC